MADPTRYYRLSDLVGQPEVTPETAAANRAAGRSPKNPRPGKPGIYPISESTLWRRVKEGKFPAPVRLSTHVIAWRGSDLPRP